MDNCKGLVFRIRDSRYWSDKTQTLHNKKTATLLKRDSCNSCYLCQVGIAQIIEFQSDDLINEFNNGDKVKYEVYDPEYGEGEFVKTI